MRTVVIDVGDDALLRTWYAVEAASIAHDRPLAIQRTYDALANAVRNPSPYRSVELHGAFDGDRLVGVAEISWRLQDNLHLAEAEIHVLPEHRRRGVGRSLHAALDATRRREARTTMLGELTTALDGDGAAMAFATSFGYESVHQEEHLTVALPLDLTDLVRPVPGWQILTWGDRCPDEHVAGFIEMRERMDQDVPLGGVAFEAPPLDLERVRTSEERLARSYRSIVAAARHDDGAWGGYSLLYLPHGETDVLQDDTLVMPAHRGRGLGLQLKLATLDVLRREHPERVLLHTWTDPGNTAMYRTNERFGYRPVERMHEMQRVSD